MPAFLLFWQKKCKKFNDLFELLLDLFGLLKIASFAIDKVNFL